MKADGKSNLFDAPGNYRIRVLGRYAAPHFDALCGMSHYTSRVHGNPAITTLTGVVVDQACLISVLIELYDLGYPLLDVKRLSDVVPEQAAPGG